MGKRKVAISLDNPLLELVDSKVGSELRNRSQAIEFFLRKGLGDSSINTAVLLVRGDHQRHSFDKLKGESLFKHQLNFFREHGVRRVCIITQQSSHSGKFFREVDTARRSVGGIEVNIFQIKARGNAQALYALRNELPDNFIVMSGDVYNNFNLRGMAERHLNSSKLATMGLMLRDKPQKFGNATMDGDLVVAFSEKPKRAESYVVNSGVYVFSPAVFKFFGFGKAVSLEQNVFPRLARERELVGHFTRGEYLHMAERKRTG